jgi:hypothetical protein
MAMRLTVLSLVGCLACDSGATKVVAAPPAAAPAAPDTLKAASAPAPASPLPAAAAANPPPANPPPSPGAEVPSGELRTDGAPDCRFQRPKFWAAEGAVTWLGSCKKGFAEGRGVIVDVVEGIEPQHFYGRLAQGFLSIGVLHTAAGFMSGRWENGVVIKESAETIAARTIESFDVAAAAATALSKSLAKKDPKASRFYAEEARDLLEQMD